MGVNLQSLKLFLDLRKNKKIYSGDLLILGKQEFGLNLDEVKKKFSLNKLKSLKGTKIIDDRLFFKYLSNNIKKIDILDIRKNVGANIFLDLNEPIGKKYHNKYDFIYDGSVLDNIFNPAQAIINLSNMLKRGGTIVSINNSSFAPGVFTALSPEFFYSFYALNKFKHCEVFLTVQKAKQIKKNHYPTDLYIYSPFYKKNKKYDFFKFSTDYNGVYRTMVVATKGNVKSLALKKPTNLQYITKNKENYLKRKYSRKYLKYKPQIKQTKLLYSHYTLLKTNF